MAYASASDVAALCQNVLGADDTFSTSTCPTLAQVNRWLTSGCAVLETRLQAQGYSVPPGSTTSIYEALKDLNTLYAVTRVEMVRTNPVFGPGQRTRGQVFREMFWEELKELLSTDLTQAGLSRSSTATIYVGGISEADKDTVEDDSDRVEPRFSRDMFDFAGTLKPKSDTSAS